MSVASVRASFPAINSRARNGESADSSCENFTFHGHTLWEMCRYNRFEMALLTGRLTAGISMVSPSARHPYRGRVRVEQPATLRRYAGV